jgi:hypothetical protein
MKVAVAEHSSFTATDAGEHLHGNKTSQCEQGSDGGHQNKVIRFERHFLVCASSVNGAAKVNNLFTSFHPTARVVEPGGLQLRA